MYRKILVILLSFLFLSCSASKLEEGNAVSEKVVYRDGIVNQNAVELREVGYPQLDLAAMEIEDAEQESLMEDEVATGSAVRGLANNTEVEAQKPKTGVKKDERASNKWVRKAQTNNIVQVKVGRDEYLDLQSVRVIATIEGIRARTVVDHMFYNPYERTLEGNFRYKLPDNASISYFAFYPEGVVPEDSKQQIHLPSLPSAAQIQSKPIADYLSSEESYFGKPKVAHAVAKQKALASYEAIVRRGIDPALVEWAGGNVFSTRVFPLAPKGYYRIVIVYEQTLVALDDVITYRFSFPDTDSQLMLNADKNYIENPQFGEVATEENDAWISYQAQVRNKEVVFRAKTKSSFITSLDSAQGITYTYGRLSPQFSSQMYASRSDKAIFMLDTSLSQENKEFGSYIALLEKILERNHEIRKFNVLFFDVESGWLQQGWVDNDAAGRNFLKEQTQVVHLEGATDVAQALDHLTNTSWLNQAGSKVDIFFLSNGQHTWGEVSLRKSLRKFSTKLSFSPHFYCYNLGLGTANIELFDLLNQFGGGSFANNEGTALDELAVAHRRSVLFIESITGHGIEDIVVAGNARNIYPGQHVLVAGKLSSESPQITITGQVAGVQKTFTFDIPATMSGILAPRAFAELAVRKMESLEDPSLEEAIIAYARYFSIPGKTCSLLMLETQEDYDEFNINLEKDSRKVENTRVAKLLSSVDASLDKSISSQKDSFIYFWEKLQDNELMKINVEHVAKLLALVSEADFSISQQKLQYSYATKTTDATSSKDYRTYITKAQNYNAQQNLFGYLRALSSIVELEPHESSALRVAGYLLLKEKMATQAVPVFRRVRDKRPFEPHVYRDLAKSYAALEKYNVAALYYEVLLGGVWDSRFRQIDVIAKEEYEQVLRKMIAANSLADYARTRLKSIASRETQYNDIVVTITWSTDNTDVDLWVIEPSGEKCYYENKNTKSGGTLLDDVTQGYGPERYRLKKASAGKYNVAVHYFRSNQNRISDLTFVETTITLHSGSPQAKTTSFYTLLSSSKEEVHINSLRW